jgi:CheY-like chemotaxis protein
VSALDDQTDELGAERFTLRYSPVPLSRPRVLIVEDDPQLAHLYCTSLALRGIGCARAADGFAALQSIEQARPSLILLDLNLPTVSGWAILQDLAANPLTSGIPVIVVTGVEPKPRLPHALVVLCKPCDPDHIAKIVVDHLSALR